MHPKGQHAWIRRTMRRAAECSCIKTTWQPTTEPLTHLAAGPSSPPAVGLPLANEKRASHNGRLPCPSHVHVDTASCQPCIENKGKCEAPAYVPTVEPLLDQRLGLQLQKNHRAESRNWTHEKWSCNWTYQQLSQPSSVIDAHAPCSQCLLSLCRTLPRSYASEWARHGQSSPEDHTRAPQPSQGACRDRSSSTRNARHPIYCGPDTLASKRGKADTKQQARPAT